MTVELVDLTTEELVTIWLLYDRAMLSGWWN
jgi:hypothetical protein